MENLEKEIETLKQQLKASQEQNMALLNARVVSACWTMARGFAEAARVIRLEGGIVPIEQIKAVTEMKLKQANITAMQQKGDKVQFNPSTMKNVNKDSVEGELVEIIDPSYQLAINNEEYILNIAWVKTITE